MVGNFSALVISTIYEQSHERPEARVIGGGHAACARAVRVRGLANRAVTVAVAVKKEFGSILPSDVPRGSVVNGN